METIILVLIGAIAGGAIVNMMYVCKEGKSGSKGITDEYYRVRHKENSKKR